MGEVFIVGVGMTPFGKFPQRSLKDLTREAVSCCLQDAAISIAGVEAIYFANAGQAALEGQYMIAGQVALRSMGFQNIPIINTENACASGSTALYQAIGSVASGQSDVALAIGAEKMFIEDRDRLFGIFDGAWDVHKATENYELLKTMAEGFGPPLEKSDKRSLFMDVYAYLSRFHMQRFGTSQAQLAMVASKNRYHATMNPLSQFRQAVPVEEILAAREIAWPLTLPMCAPISDGAAAALVCNGDALGRFEKNRAVTIKSCVLGSGSERKAEEFDRHLCRVAALKAYEKAGVGPQDMSLAEVHDATAFAEIQQTENLGFCDIGMGGPLVESGATKLGGRIPVNVSGGLESKGHPIGATGLAQIYEMTLQLRAEAGDRQVEGARFAIAENGGGFYGIEEASACITILAAPGI